MEELLQKRLRNIYKQTEKLDFLLVGMSATACAKSGRGVNVSSDYNVMSKLEQIKSDIRQELREIVLNQMCTEEVIERICNALENGEENG